jgi:phosphoribosyl 1,2-cyclic phosphodiesterase
VRCGGFAETLFEAAGVPGGVGIDRAGAMAAVTADRSRGGRAAGESRAGPVWMSVLGSSSRGNCAVLRVGEGRNYRLVLLDAGFSPARTRRMLSDLGVDIGRVCAVMLTHTHRDHLHAGWVRGLPGHARFFVHERHRGAAKRAGVLYRKTEIFGESEGFSVAGLGCRAALAPHDEMGSSVFRFDGGDADGERFSVGYATDIGAVPEYVGELLSGVGVLAIESNYCPRMQVASGRHPMLVDRVMAGAGHLSNEECAAAVVAIGPGRVVLLHLSRECNDPELAVSAHAGRGYAVEAAAPIGPGDWIAVSGGGAGGSSG